MSESTAIVRPCNDHKLIPCRAGLRPIPNSPNETRLWVESPRTGKQIVIASGWLNDLREKAPRLIGRIAQARGSGKAIVLLSIAELKALAELQSLIAERSKPLPRGRWTARPWGA